MFHSASTILFCSLLSGRRRHTSSNLHPTKVILPPPLGHVDARWPVIWFYILSPKDTPLFPFYVADVRFLLFWDRFKGPTSQAYSFSPFLGSPTVNKGFWDFSSHPSPDLPPGDEELHRVRHLFLSLPPLFTVSELFSPFFSEVGTESFFVWDHICCAWPCALLRSVSSVDRGGILFPSSLFPPNPPPFVPRRLLRMRKRDALGPSSLIFFSFLVFP